MAYRFTNTDKWNDAWFYELKPLQKLLFIYLCDNCDIAGFIEINFKKWVSDINSNTRDLQGALKGLARGLIYSNNNDCIYIRNFLKHQKNFPLNEKNKAHLGIIKRFNLYSYKFDIKDITEFIEGASKGLGSPTGNGIGIGNGIRNTNSENFKNFIFLFNKISNRDFKGDEKTKKQFNARLKDKYTLHDFEIAITNLYNDSFHKDNDFKYATPEFITRENKLNMFLNVTPKKDKKHDTVNDMIDPNWKRE
jgi:uncharacterized phage protein (TIGR02220 family)